MWTLDRPSYVLEVSRPYPNVQYRVTFHLVDDANPPNHDIYVEGHLDDGSTEALALLVAKYLVQRNQTETALAKPLDDVAFLGLVEQAIQSLLNPVSGPGPTGATGPASSGVV